MKILCQKKERKRKRAGKRFMNSQRKIEFARDGKAQRRSGGWKNVFNNMLSSSEKEER